MPPTVAVVFWGLCRSAKYTAPSIKQFVYDPLLAYGYSIVKIAHLLDIDGAYANPRAHEDVSVYERHQERFLDLDVCTVEDQALLGLDLKAYCTQPDPWATDYANVHNVVRSLYSLQKALALAPRCDAVVFVRPDVTFLGPVPEDALKHAISATKPVVITPDFGKHGHNGSRINDRFAICNPAGAIVYANRFAAALEYSMSRPLHSETFLVHVLRKAGALHREARVRFRRTRHGGHQIDSGVKQ